MSGTSIKINGYHCRCRPIASKLNGLYYQAYVINGKTHLSVGRYNTRERALAAAIAHASGEPVPLSDVKIKLKQGAQPKIVRMPVVTAPKMTPYAITLVNKHNPEMPAITPFADSLLRAKALSDFINKRVERRERERFSAGISDPPPEKIQPSAESVKPEKRIKHTMPPVIMLPAEIDTDGTPISWKMSVIEERGYFGPLIYNRRDKRIWLNRCATKQEAYEAAYNCLASGIIPPKEVKARILVKLKDLPAPSVSAYRWAYSSSRQLKFTTRTKRPQTVYIGTFPAYEDAEEQAAQILTSGKWPANLQHGNSD